MAVAVILALVTVYRFALTAAAKVRSWGTTVDKHWTGVPTDCSET